VQCYRGAIIRLQVARRHRLACTGEGQANLQACCGVLQMTTDDNDRSQRPLSLYCCCNCGTQSLRTATQACWFHWRVCTFSLLTYL